MINFCNCIIRYVRYAAVYSGDSGEERSRAVVRTSWTRWQAGILDRTGTHKQTVRVCWKHLAEPLVPWIFKSHLLLVSSSNVFQPGLGQFTAERDTDRRELTPQSSRPWSSAGKAWSASLGYFPSYISGSCSQVRGERGRWLTDGFGLHLQ